MKIKYRVSDGAVIALGAMPDLQAGPGEAVEDFDGSIPAGRLDFLKRTSPNTLIEKTQVQKDAILDSERTFTRSRVRAFVNQGASLQEKFDRLLKVVEVLAQSLKESDV